MSDRPERSNGEFWASSVQSMFACLALLIGAWLVVFTGAFHFDNGPFQTANAVRTAVVLFPLVAAVVASAILLWLRSKWGWYLTVFLNGLLESIMIYLLVTELQSRHRYPYNRSLYPDHLYAVLHLLLLLPVIILLLPQTRRDFLGPRHSGTLTEDSSEAKQA